jgi:hypothetical protein
VGFKALVGYFSISPYFLSGLESEKIFLNLHKSVHTMGPPSGITNKQWVRFNFYFVLEHFLGADNFEKFLGKNRKALYNEIDLQLKNSNRAELLPMPEENNPDITLEEFNNKYIKNFLPVVFRQAAGNWPSVKKWSFNFFKENYGEKEISLVDNVGIIDRKNPQQFENTTFSTYIDELSKGSLKYLKFSRIMDDDSTLKGDFDLKWLRKFQLPGSFGENFLMFMGNAETLTPTHCGFGNTLFVQVTGKKKWIFWKPNERIFFDPRAKRRNYNYTDADPYQVNDPDFPLFKYAKRFEVILEPGDVLWFPSHLWHHVESVTGGTSVAHKFVHLPSCWRSSSVLTTLFFFATHPVLLVDVFYLATKNRDYTYTHKHAEVG